MAGKNLISITVATAFTFALIVCMILTMSPLGQSLLAGLATAGTAYAAGLSDITNVVLFMQENRAFDHYFGTMAGVRGFNDPNVQVNNGTPVWYQKVNCTLSNATTTLLPFYLNYLGGTWEQATQCALSVWAGLEASADTLFYDLRHGSRLQRMGRQPRSSEWRP